MHRNEYHAEIAALRAENELLRAQLAEQRAAFNAGVDSLMRSFGVTVYQARLLAALASGNVMTRDHIERLCSRVENEDPRHVDQQVKRIRRRNLPGVVITTVYGAGYMVEGDSLRVIRDAMAMQKH